MVCEHNIDEEKYLMSLRAVRERCELIYSAAVKGDGGLKYFTVDEELLKSRAAPEIIALIERDYNDGNRISCDTDMIEVAKKIPPHGRWRHFAPFSFKIGRGLEYARILVDLFVVAVLLDAGTGGTWSFKDKSGDDCKIISRSEGLAVATQRFFETGGFSANPKTDPLRVDASRLCDLTVAELEEAFQCTSENELAGIEGRVHILHSLGEAIMNNHDAFPNAQRPSDFLDVIIRESHHIGDELSSPQYELEKFWDNIIVAGFSKIWLRNRGPCGDCWSLKIRSNEKIMVPFHKLSQWLTYSLLEVIEATINIHFVDTDQLTGLAEYRNGGFFFDLKVINLTDEGIKLVHGKIVPQDHQLIIEWRALTVILLDKLAEELRTRLNLTASQLPLAKILEAGTWKGGRELAMRLRPESGGAPPIMIQSDGTLF